MGDLEETFRALVRDEVRRVLREELRPELLTPAQAGALVGRSAKTILSWVREGKLQRHGPGKPLVSREELLSLEGAPAPRAQRRGDDGSPSAEAEVRRLIRRTG